MVAIGTALVALMAGPVGAATELIRIEVDQIVRGDEGDVISVGARDFPPEVVGLSCDLFISTVNQRSVHPDNDLLIVLGSRTLELLDFEDASGVVHEFRSLEPLPDRVELFVRLGPDGVSSGGFTVSFECITEPPPTSSTSTTTTSTSTTSSTSSTTSSTTSTTTTSTSTTSTSTSTSTTTTTVGQPPATTAAPTVPPPTVGGVSETNPELAFTGGFPFGLLAGGVMFVLSGGAFVLAGRNVRREVA